MKAMRRTLPELYNDYAKSVINEFFYLKELKKNRMMYVGLWQIYNEEDEKFLGDFEIDLQPYLLDSQEHEMNIDLRNYKELYTQPNYVAKDMRKKGWIKFQLKIKSSIKQYLMDTMPKNQFDALMQVVAPPPPEVTVTKTVTKKQISSSLQITKDNNKSSGIEYY